MRELSQGRAGIIPRVMRELSQGGVGKVSVFYAGKFHSHVGRGSGQMALDMRESSQ